MKKLLEKLKNTPTDVSLVCSSASSLLNREETLSVKNIVRTNNTPEANLLQQHTGGQNLRVSVMVYVLNRRGAPLMSCSPRKARVLVRRSLVKVVKKCPFTIQLCYSTGETKQELELGMDSGSKFIGLSVCSKEKELLVIEAELDQKTKERLYDRKMCRKRRRSRNRWYRKCRFLNRVGKFKKVKNGWLPPSIERKYQTHLKLIKEAQKLLPISEENITIEVGNFDIQKLINPEISGKEYQKGNLYNYNNTKSFILVREQNKCQICGEIWKKNDKFVLHHKIQRSDGGTDRPENLALLHESCHKKFHKKGLKMVQNKQYKEATFMNIIKNRFQKDLPKCSLTFGYITKTKREELKLEKSHINDAFVISGGNSQERVRSFKVEQRRRGNRTLQLNRKGYKPSIRRKKYRYQPKDIVKIKGIWYEVVGVHNYGRQISVKDFNNKKFDFNVKKIEKHFFQGTLIWSC